MEDKADPKCPVKEMSEMRVSRPAMNGAAGKDSTSPLRRVQRNKSGPQGRMTRVVGRTMSGRAPPRRSQSSKIKRPTFHPVSPDGDGATDQIQGKRRGLNRSHSHKAKGPNRVVPARSGSFQRRRVPDRTCSSSSLRRGAAKRQQQLGNVSVTNSTAETDDISVSDSVFTSISIQTMDSIMVRKKQIPPNQEKHGVNRKMAIEFDDNINGMDQDDYYGADGDVYYDEELSIFSESWCSSESCEVLSDYEEGEMDGAILEDDEDGVEDEIIVVSPEEKGVGCTSSE